MDNYGIEYYTGLFDSCGCINLSLVGRSKDTTGRISRSIIVFNDNMMLLRMLKNFFGYGIIDDRACTFALRIDKKDFIADFCSRVGLYSICNAKSLDHMMRSCCILFGSPKNSKHDLSFSIIRKVINSIDSYQHDLLFSSPPECAWLGGYIDGSKGKVAFLDTEKNEYYFANGCYNIEHLNGKDKKIKCVLEFKNKKSLSEYLQQLIPFLFVEEESISKLLRVLLKSQ
jgi:hypothetical protein